MSRIVQLSLICPRRALLASLLIFPVLPAGLSAQTAAERPGILVLAAKAGHRCFAATIRVTGTVVPRKVGIVALESDSLRLSELLVKEGDLVTAGQRVARLTPAKTGNPQETRTAPSQERGGGDFYLNAPTAGRIFKIGSASAGGPEMPEPLIQMAVGDEFELQAGIPAAQIPKLAPGQTVRIDFDGGLDLLGRVRLVPAEVNRASQLGDARIAVEGNPNLATFGIAHISIDAERSCGISIPRSAILQQSEVTSVQVITSNVVKTRQIRLGLLSEDVAEVAEGLQLGELVVAHAGTSLHDGDEVSPSIVPTSSE